MTRQPLLWVLMAALGAGVAHGSERPCEQSESTVTMSPQGTYAASVQHQVCATAAGRAAAAVTVYVGPATAPQDGARVVAIAVPRSRDEWPRAVWRSGALLEVWVPNLASVLEVRDRHEDIAVVLKYCADDPAARERVVRHEADMQRWMAATTQWNELRKRDAAAAGERPQRPAEPKLAHRACTDADIDTAR